MRSLLRTQFRLAAVRLHGAGLRGGRPAAAVPARPRAARRARCSASPCRGRCSPDSIYPAFVIGAWLYVRQAERNERHFADLVDRSMSTGRSRRRHGGRPCSSARSASASPAPPPTSSSPPARSARSGTPPRSAASICRRPRSSGVAGLILSLRRGHALAAGRLDRRLPGATGAGVRAAAPLGRLHAARLRRGQAGVAWRVRRTASVLVVLIGWFYLMPQFQSAGLVLRTITGAPVWAGGLLVAVVVAGQRAVGRHAVDHVRAGVPVLAQAHRAGRTGDLPVAGLAGRRGSRPVARRTPPSGRRR